MYYSGLIKQTLNESKAYRLNFLLSFIVDLIPLLGTLFLVKFIYSSGSSLNEWDYQSLILYFIIARVSGDIFTPVAWWDITSDIKYGSLNYHLLKPYSYFSHNYCVIFSTKIMYLLTSIAVILLTMYLFIGIPEISFSWSNPFIYIAYFILSSIISYQMTFLLSISAFEFVEIEFINSIMSFALPIMTGVFLPFDIYPNWVKSILEWLPTSFIAYYPAKLLSSNHLTSNEILIIFSKMLVWLIIFTYVIKVVWKSSLKKYEGIG